MTLFSSQLKEILAIDPTADAVEFRRSWYSWGQLADVIAAIRAAFESLELGQDARIGVMLRSYPASLAATAAVVTADACMVSINPLFPDDRLLQDLKSLRPPVVIAHAEDLKRPGMLNTLASIGCAVIELRGVLDGAGLLPGFEKITGAGLTLIEPGIIVEMLTSGTTGAPKRIPLKRSAFEKSFIGALSYEKGRKPGEPAKLRTGVTILSAPMTHIGGLWGALTCMLGGRKACLLEKFSVEEWHGAIVRHRPKVAGGVPAVLRMVLDANIPKEDLSSLIAIRTGAAPVDIATIQEFWDRYKIPVLQNYGATEFSGAIAGWTLADFLEFRETKLSSVGRFQPGVIGRVVAENTGDVLTPSAQGILEVKSAQFGNGEEWLRTTDRAAIDEDGFLYIFGRADNAIMRGGFKVHPDDVVSAIELHPAVREAVVVGIEDKRLGAVPVAAVILKAGAASPAIGELSTFLREKLLPYQVPTQFLIVDDVPRTESMKPALARVRELFALTVEA
jgi:long-chain acyl-CoA synthetase